MNINYKYKRKIYYYGTRTLVFIRLNQNPISIKCPVISLNLGKNLKEPDIFCNLFKKVPIFRIENGFHWRYRFFRFRFQSLFLTCVSADSDQRIINRPVRHSQKFASRVISFRTRPDSIPLWCLYQLVQLFDNIISDRKNSGGKKNIIRFLHTFPPNRFSSLRLRTDKLWSLSLSLSLSA